MTLISNIRRLMLSSREIAPDAYQLTIGGVNVVLMAGEKLTLIDAGLYGAAFYILDFIRQLGRSPEELELIVLTHRHIDHIGGLAGLRKHTPARLAIHKDDITIGEPVPPRHGVKHRLLQLPGSDAVRKVLAVRKEDVDVQLSGGEELEALGGLRVIHTPGHSPGSISLYSPKHKLLLAGDALRKRRRVLLLPPKVIAHFDRDKAIESIERLSHLDIETLCLGHGMPVTGNIRGMMTDLLARAED